MFRFEQKEKLTRGDIRAGLRMYVFDGICSTGMSALQSGIYLTAFALAIGASQKQIGLIASIAFISQVMQLPGLWLVNKFPQKKKITALFAGIARLFWIPIILIPVVFTGNRSMFLLFLLVSALLAAVPAPAWNALLRDVLPQRHLGRINSRRTALSTGLGLMLTLAGGYFIDWWKAFRPETELVSFSIVFAIGLLFGLTGITAILRMPEPRSATASIPLKELLTAPLRDRNFRMLMTFTAVWNFSVSMSGPFFIVYMMHRLGLSLFHVTILIVINQLTNIFFLRIWGRIADRFSNKSILGIGCPLFLISVILWTFTTLPEPHAFTFVLVVIIQVLNGMAVSGVTLGTTNIIMKLSPAGQAHSYITAMGLTNSVVGTLAPLVGGLLADYFANIQLNVPLELYTDTHEYLVPVINLKGLDFLFLLTFLVGLYALHRLALVVEEGEVTERKLVIDELTESIITPMKSLSVLAGISRIVIMPLSGIMHIASKMSGRGRKRKIQ